MKSTLRSASMKSCIKSISSFADETPDATPTKGIEDKSSAFEVDHSIKYDPDEEAKPVRRKLEYEMDERH